MRWLHCSDFHTGKDRTAQEKLASKMIDHVKSRISEGFIPDLVFITGDIANFGLKREFEEFHNSFVQPLREALGGGDWGGRILAVPGNHDVDRNQNNNFDREGPLGAGSRFFETDKNGKLQRDILAPRFKAYRKGVRADLSDNWLCNPEGAFAEIIPIKGVSFGVVGINTAWLSKDNHDRLKLTPGVELVEAALERVKDCPVRIVLGHHPLTWMHDDHARRLRALFGDYRVIYLHGHLHQADGTQEDGAGNPFLAIQSGAAFQARDNEPWRNGLLWGEIDLAGRQVLLSPRYWNPDNRDWPVETGRFPENRRRPNTDWWAYPLPSNGISSKANDWCAPDGWELLTAAQLETRRRDVSAAEAERFFDGAEPDWGLALCPKIPRRARVSDLAQQIATYGSRERPLVMLLTGPGGEGKSMALRQILVTLLESDSPANVLWHVEETRPLPGDALAQLPKGAWVIASDAADLVERNLFECLAALHRAGRYDVTFLLCARDTDWRACGAEKREWARHADYRVESLSGLTQEDAALIASAWAAFDAPGATPNLPERGQALFEATQRDTAVSEGSLLGGVLAVRHGAGLRGHVARLMERLGEQRLASGGTLSDAFAYIAAMHAEGLDFLSRPVLARVLNCDPRHLGQQVIVPLAREAAASGGSVLLTRHRRIAAAAVAIMVEEYGEDMADRFVALARAAITARMDGVFVPELHRWDYELPNHFIGNSPTTAIRIAQALLEANGNDANLAVNLARICRKCDEPQWGAEALKNFTGEVGNLRGFWYEWGTCAGNVGEHAVSALLGGWSLADQAALSPPDTNRAKLSLAGLGVALRELHKQYRDPRFIAGLGAVAYLGPHLPFDSTAHRYFAQYKSDADAEGANSADAAQALEQLGAALAAAWEVCGKREELAARMPTPDAMKFTGLARLFNR